MKSVISEDMRLGNDTSHEIFADNFARNRGENFVQLFHEKVARHFFDRLIFSAEPGNLSLIDQTGRRQ